MPRRPQEDPGHPLDDHAHRVLSKQVQHHGLVRRVAAEPRKDVLVKGHAEQHGGDEGLHRPGHARGCVAAEREGQEAAHREAGVREVAENVLFPRLRVRHAGDDAAVAEAAAPAVPDSGVDDGRPARARGDGRGEGKEGEDGRGGGGAQEERGEERPGEHEGKDLGEAVEFFFCLGGRGITTSDERGVSECGEDRKQKKRRRKQSGGEAKKRRGDKRDTKENRKEKKNSPEKREHRHDRHGLLERRVPPRPRQVVRVEPDVRARALRAPGGIVVQDEADEARLVGGLGVVALAALQRVGGRREEHVAARLLLRPRGRGRGAVAPAAAAAATAVVGGPHYGKR